MNDVVFRSFLAVLVTALHPGVLSVSTDETEANVAKRQTNFQNTNFNGQQVPQEYFDFIQQTDAVVNPVPPELGQQSAQVFPTGSSSDVFPPTTTTTLSPFAAEQVRFQEEYARRTLIEQQNVLIRPRPRPFAKQLVQSQPQSQLQSQPQTQPQPLRFIGLDGQVREQNFVPRQPQTSFVSQQQQTDFVQQQPQADFVQQQQEQAELIQQQQQADFAQPTSRPNVLSSVRTDEPFSYAQVHFGPVTDERPEPLVSRPKGQRSVSKPRANHPVEPLVQQTIDYPSTTLVNPATVSSRLLQNVVYVQPNGQMYKPIEDSEQVIQIPRKNNNNYYFYPQATSATSAPATAATATTSSSTTTDSGISIEEQPVIVIPRPKKPNTQRPRQESRKSGRTQQHPAQLTERPKQQTQYQFKQQQPQPQLQQEQQLQKQPQQLQERPHQLQEQPHQLQEQPQQLQEQPQQLQQQYQKSPEVEPNSFFTSFLSRFQEQQQQTTATTSPLVLKPSRGGGGQRSKGGNRSEVSKYLPDRNQLQLLQFPHELKSLSSAELRALEDASTQIAAANDKFVGRKQQALRNRPVSTTVKPLPPRPAVDPDQREQYFDDGTFVNPTPVDFDHREQIIGDNGPLVRPSPVDFDQREQFFGANRVVPSSSLGDPSNQRYQFSGSSRPVPTPVELNEQQRQFLASQGIRHLYRVEYDQSGNVLPLTYVLALDNRPKRGEQQKEQKQR